MSTAGSGMIVEYQGPSMTNASAERLSGQLQLRTLLRIPARETIEQGARRASTCIPVEQYQRIYGICACVTHCGVPIKHTY